MVKPRLLHQLRPTDLLMNMLVNPSTQFVELLFAESLWDMVYWRKHKYSLELVCVQRLSVYYNLVMY